MFILTSNWIGAIIPWSLLELPAASGELSASDQSYLVALNLLEEFSKPLSLSFRLLANILADELTLAVLYGLVPIAVPIPVFLLGLFTSGIQALVFATLAGAYLGESIECLLE